ncbi:MAG: helix-turn-helix transcriptional regulator [Saprospiraceae bacterium]|nr:helix-turn-helix transcriptional regulator [Saprospiraceae bacterium]MBK7737040.1 helix-turn-helix transcriptional regulator [Saprospiraceae bacterium]MBK7914365.1 helix-turn-helix transcriptional regulator [Saprospiraceae bacterium]
MEANSKLTNLLQNILDRIDPESQFKSNNKIGLAVTLADLLEVNKLNKIKFAELVKKRPSEITKWLSGDHNFTIDTLSEICFKFGIPIRDLFEEDLTETEIEKNKSSYESPELSTDTNTNLSNPFTNVIRGTNLCYKVTNSDNEYFSQSTKIKLANSN